MKPLQMNVRRPHAVSDQCTFTQLYAEWSRADQPPVLPSGIVSGTYGSLSPHQNG
jgi:hypothetical protein